MAQVHGEYFYKSGELKLVDRYVAGQCVEETWYKPDGTVIANEHFVDGTGTGYYLYEDGTIKLKMTYVKGLAHGPARFFSTNGEVIEVVEYVNGEKSPGDTSQ